MMAQQMADSMQKMQEQMAEQMQRHTEAITTSNIASPPATSKVLTGGGDETRGRSLSTASLGSNQGEFEIDLNMR